MFKRLVLMMALLFITMPVFAQETTMTSRQAHAHVMTIESSEMLPGGVWRYVFQARLDDDASVVTVNTADSYTAGVGYSLKEGDRVILQFLDNADGTTRVFLADIHRERNLLWLTIAFGVIIVAVGLWRGLLSLLGLGITAAIITLFVLPRILAGADPVVTTVLASILILAINIPLSHGFKRESGLALLSSCAGLALVTILTPIFIRFAHLSGLASEEGALLFWELNGLQVPVGILAAGIILATVGVLDDIAITQTEVVDELVLADSRVSRKELFVRAMRVGRHHIASTVNTLVLVYVGTALPIFLLMAKQSIGFLDFVNAELIAEEIVRTLAGTTALILTVPISTWLATFPHRVVDTHRKAQ